MSLLLGLVAGLGGLAVAGYGAHKQSKAAKEAKDELAKQEATDRAELKKQRAATEAWYNRNYYQDYLNTIEAQNALKRYRKAWDEQVQQARARQAVSGGTPEQAQAVAEAGGEAMGDMIGNLAAAGQQDRQAIDAQKLAMDMNLSDKSLELSNNISQQRMAIANQEQQAGANLINNGIGVATGAISGLPTGTSTAKTSVDAVPGSEAAVAAGRDTRINPTSYNNPIITAPKELTEAERVALGRTNRGYKNY